MIIDSLCSNLLTKHLMKKLLLTLAVGLAATSASAEVVFGYDFKHEFEPTAENLSGWIFRGPEGTPTGTYASFFNGYTPSTPVSIVGLDGTTDALFTNSQYKEGTESDTWCITPEFTITNDSEIIEFGVAVSGMSSRVRNNYYLYISEGGTDVADFTQVDASTITGSSNGAQYLNAGTRRIKLEGYNGKKVRLAFVNAGNSEGILGFYSITCGSWICNITPAAKFDYIFTDGNSDIKFDFTATAPETSTYAQVDFKTESGYTFSSRQRMAMRLNATRNCEAVISKPKISADTEAYTLTVTPEFDGARPLIIKGVLCKSDKKFDKPVVMEEQTGTWCGWCPFGAAALEVYSNTYDGKDGKKAIPIALHGGYAGEPMLISEEVSDYAVAFQSDFMSLTGGSYPYIVFNRASGGLPTNPASINLEDIFADKAFIKAELTNVYLDSDDTMSAKFNLTPAFTAPAAGINISVVVTEDEVTGNNADYNQNSYLDGQGITAEYVRSQFGAEWAEALSPFFGCGSVLNYTKAVYQHVARAAYPSLKGVEMGEAFVYDQVRSAQIDFRMPANVNNKENTNVILLVTNRGTGEILAADMMSYADFTSGSGVDTTDSDDSIEASLANGILTVATPSATLVEVFGIDGSLRLSRQISEGVSTFDLGADGGVVIVRLTADGISKTFKAVNR